MNVYYIADITKYCRLGRLNNKKYDCQVLESRPGPRLGSRTSISDKASAMHPQYLCLI